MNEEKKLLSEFIKFMEKLLNEFGVFDSEINRKSVAREIFNRFFSNLISLENYLVTKDTMGSALLQRYNHELFIDFIYLFDDEGEGDKLEKFFNYTENSDAHRWSSLTIADRRSYIPPWYGTKEVYKKVYERLSKMAHSNIVSMRLNRRGEEYEYLVIKLAISLCIIDIINCLLHKPFRDEFPNIDWENSYFALIYFQNTAISVLANSKINNEKK